MYVHVISQTTTLCISKVENNLSGAIIKKMTLIFQKSLNSAYWCSHRKDVNSKTLYFRLYHQNVAYEWTGDHKYLINNA